MPMRSLDPSEKHFIGLCGGAADGLCLRPPDRLGALLDGLLLAPDWSDVDDDMPACAQAHREAHRHIPLAFAWKAVVYPFSRAWRGEHHPYCL
mmetsp:Transcript_20847/g.34330  ORF Transcript_20847/g.34330 Transcript_20847/m.34330 type:complete len:93 (-) Transcript_20847:485-763(-)